MNELLTSNNFILYCAKHYDNPHCITVEEFNEDIKRIKYIKKLFTRYQKGEELKERLILNHLIVLNNIFGPEHLPRILFCKMENQLELLKPFLVFLNIMPKYVEVNNKVYRVNDIKSDTDISKKLMNI